MAKSPDISIGKLHIWVHGKEFPHSAGSPTDSYDDAGFLRTTVSYKTACATVEITGSILHYVDLLRLEHDCRNLQQTNTGKIVFSTLEPCIHYELEANKLGHLKGRLVLRPDPVYETHTYEIEDLDLTYLPAMITECDTVLRKYFGSEEKK